MKKIKLLILFLVFAIATANVFGQVNPTISVIGQGTTNPMNVGEVPLGGTLDLLIVVGNTGAANVTANRLRPVITVPALVTILPDAQQTGLPAGWSILSNAGGIIRLCSGADVIAPSASRSIIIKVQGANIGGPTTFSGQLNFGGTSSCAASGAAPSGNNTADDNSQSTVTVVAALVPLTLTDFSATLKNCQPLLAWTTESEINTDRFEIERSNASNSNEWKFIGTVAANGNSASKLNYSFNDKNISATSEKVFYRLKMIDKDGRFNYSNILPVLVNCKTGNLLVYPNPVHDGKLYVSLAGTVGYAEGNLISMTGQIVLKSKMNNGTNYLNVSNMVDGVYVLKISDKNGFEKTVKVSIKH